MKGGLKLKIFAKIKAIYVIFIVMLFVGIMIPFVAVFRKFNNRFRYLTSKAILIFSGIRLNVVGKPDKDADIFIINHQSMIDIMAIEVASQKNDVAWVAKLELFNIKYFGLSLSLTDMIDLNREDRQGIIKLLKDVKDRVSNRRTVAIFPEGTRNVENKFLPFKSGAGIIANKLKLKVQPVVLVNTAKRFDTKNFLASNGQIQVVFLESFYATKERDWLQESKDEMLKTFLAKIEK